MVLKLMAQVEKWVF